MGEQIVTIMTVHGDNWWHAHKGGQRPPEGWYTECGKRGSEITTRNDWHAIRHRCPSCDDGLGSRKKQTGEAGR